MCHLGEVSRAGFYRSLQERQALEEDMEDTFGDSEPSAGTSRRYGYRRIAAELRRQGMRMNHKRVARMLREDNSLGIQPKALVPTTHSAQRLEVLLNLARRLTALTYIR